MQIYRDKRLIDGSLGLGMGAETVKIDMKGFGGIMSVSQFSRSVMSNSLRPHESQHARPPCPSPTPRVHPNPCPLNR